MSRGVLSPRQVQVLQGVAEGMWDEQIGTQLNLAASTVKQYVASARGVLGARTRANAVHLAHRSGLINDGGCDRREQHPPHWFGFAAMHWCTGLRPAPDGDPGPF